MVTRDLALVLPENTTYQAVMTAIAHPSPLTGLEAVHLFDVYLPANEAEAEKRGIPAGHKSWALRLCLQAEERTWQEADIEALVLAVRDRLSAHCQARLR
jgi:phenylalanyl-tRNA synthetase beta subunit